MALAWRCSKGVTNMRILTFKRLVGLAAIGGVVYVHKQRGGTWTMASMRDTLHHLLTRATDKLGQMNQAAENARRPGDRGASMGASSHGSSHANPNLNPNGPRTRLADDARMRSPGELNKRDDDNRH
jgi:hypothetical protein